MALYIHKLRAYFSRHAFHCLVCAGILYVNTHAVFGQASVRYDQNKLAEKAQLFKNRVEYDSALKYYRLLDNYLIKENAEEQQWINQINIADVLILQREYSQASSVLYDTWSQLSQNANSDVRLQADFYQVYGSYFMGTGNADSASYYFKQSLIRRISDSGPDDTLLHYAYNKLGNLFIAQSKFDSAYFYHKKALDISLKKKQDVNYLTASSYQNLGIAAQLIGDYQLAEECYTKSLKLKELLFGMNDPGLAKIYGNLGKFFSDLSKYNIALEYYDKSENSLTQRYDRNDLLFAYLFWNKGNVYTHKGDYVKSTGYLSKAQSILEATLGPNNQDVYRLLQDLGFAYDKKGDKQLAIGFYTRAARNSDNAGNIKIYRNLGNIYMELNQADSARKYYHLSIDYAKEIFSGASYDLALCYQYYGEFLAKSQHDNNALRYYDQAAGIFIQLFGEKNKDLSKVYRLQSEYYLSISDYNTALNRIQASLVALLPGFNQSDPYINPQEEDFILDVYLQDALQQKAITLYKLSKKSNLIKNLGSCLEVCDLAVELTEKIRRTFNEEESQLILNKLARDIIDLGVMASLDLYGQSGETAHLHKAFNYSEKGQSIILLSALRGLEAQSNDKIPVSLQNLEKDVAEALAFYNNLLFQERQKKLPDNSKVQLWTDKIFNLRLKHDSILSSYKSNYPDYFRLKFDYSSISVDSVKNMLESDQALVEYFITDSLVYGFFITNDLIIARALGRKDLLKSKLDSLRKDFASSDYFNAGIKEYGQITGLSADLYDMLIRPFEQNLKNKRLIIIPDGELGYLSFDMLLSDRPSVDHESYSDLMWLIREYPISYSSSATIFFEQISRQPKRVKKSLLAFAPSYDLATKFRDATLTDSILLNLSPMVGTKEEVNAISELFPSKIRMDDQATETYFKKHAGDYNILHLAMHTIIDNQNPLYSKLIFTPASDNGMDDSYLNTYELFNLSLPGQLAVLSACNTGSGKLERGEGILSLARGFFYAGIPNVVMTLWEIEDHSSADLMTIFYENLKNGQPSDIALQQAKISYLNNTSKLFSHPYFWAGYVSIGKPSTVNEKAMNNSWNSVLIVIIIIIPLAIAYFFINKRVFFNKKRH